MEEMCGTTFSLKITIEIWSKYILNPVLLHLIFRRKPIRGNSVLISILITKLTLFYKLNP